MNAATAEATKDDAPAKAEPLIPRWQLPDWPHRDNRGGAVRCEHGMLNTVECPGNGGKEHRIYTPHTAEQVCTPGYFDAINIDLQAGDEIAGACAINSRPMQYVRLFVEDAQGGTSGPRNWSPQRRIETTVIFARFNRKDA